MSTSKGIDLYSFVGDAEYKTVFSARGNGDREDTSIDNIDTFHVEIDSKDLKSFLFIPTEMTGRFTMKALVNGREVFSSWAEINPWTGGAPSGNLTNMANSQHSFVSEDVAVSHGFYDAGGYSGQSDRAYMYVTKNFSNWMKELDLGNESFGMFVLPGSHDAGMFSIPASDDVVRSGVAAALNAWKSLSDDMKEKVIGGLIGGAAGAVVGSAMIAGFTAMLTALAGLVGIAGFGAVAAGIPKRAVINLANTQKDSIATQLKLGARFFDFRPGYNLDGSDKIVRHQHTFAAGCTLQEFLRDVVAFLTAHDGEIVVVKFGTAGFMDHTIMDVPESVINQALDEALRGTKIRVGSIGDFQQTYKSLMQSNTRLIRLGDKDEDTENGCYSNTDSSSRVIADVAAALEKAGNNDCKKLWNNFQLQGTYNGYASGIVSGVLNFSDASSSLMWTKAEFDKVTYSWLTSPLAAVAQKSGNNVVVLLNDFIDNALTDISIRLTKERIDRKRSLVYKVGDIGPAGGIIVYATPSGLPDVCGIRYLEAAPSDQSAGIHWFTSNSPCIVEIQGPDHEGIGKGKANTEFLMRTFPNDALAAKLCKELNINGYADWYLPSKDELDLIFQNVKQTGKGEFVHCKYWASSLNAGGPWVDQQDFDSGAISCTKKTAIYEFAVRAIRSF